MAFGKSPLDRALAAVDSAEAIVARWSAEAATLRAERENLEANAGSQVIADETALVRVGEQIDGLRSRERVATSAASAASAQLADARRRALEVEANGEDQKADSADAVLARHQARTAELLRLLADHDQADYVPKTINTDPVQRPGHEYPVRTKGDRLAYAARLPRTRAAVIRHFLDNGVQASFCNEINMPLGPDGANQFHRQLDPHKEIPASVKAALLVGV